MIHEIYQHQYEKQWMPKCKVEERYSFGSTCFAPYRRFLRSILIPLGIKFVFSVCEPMKERCIGKASASGSKNKDKTPWFDPVTRNWLGPMGTHDWSKLFNKYAAMEATMKAASHWQPLKSPSLVASDLVPTCSQAIVRKVETVD